MEKHICRNRGLTTVEGIIIACIIMALLALFFYAVGSYIHGSGKQDQASHTCRETLLTWQEISQDHESIFGDTMMTPEIRGRYLTTLPKITRSCPSGGKYTLLDRIPKPGEAYCTCSIPEHNPDFKAIELGEASE